MSLASLFKRKNKKSLFTTPSHSGKFYIFHKFYQWYKCDISEVDAYNPEEALKNAEKKAADIYGVKSTHFLTNGSTSGIIAAILASCKQGDRILIWEHSHPCHKNGAKLAGAQIIEYSLPFNEEWGIYERMEPQHLKNLINENSPRAVVITSPSYEGIVSDIPQISSICKASGVILIVDEAHGALYPFSHDLPESAVKYADFTIQSLHKTAGGINPTALIHCNCSLDITSALNLITTTSPSYPMLATIEANVNYLNSKKGRKKLNELIRMLKELRTKFSNIEFFGDDITKILIKKEGLSGYELSEILFDKFNIEDERTNKKSTLLLTGLGTTREKLYRLEKALKKLFN